MSLRVQLPNRLRKLPVAAYISLQRASAPVHKGFPLQIGAYTSHSGRVIVSPKRTNLITDDDTALLMYAQLKRIQRATDFRQEADKILHLAQGRYKKEFDGRGRFDPIFRVGDYTVLDRPPLFRSASEYSASEGYNKILRRKQGPYKVIGVNKTLLRILQDGSENNVSIHLATLNRTSQRHCNATEGATEHEPRLKADFEEGRKKTENDADNMYAYAQSWKPPPRPHDARCCCHRKLNELLPK